MKAIFGFAWAVTEVGFMAFLHIKWQVFSRRHCQFMRISFHLMVLLEIHDTLDDVWEQLIFDAIQRFEDFIGTIYLIACITSNFAHDARLHKFLNILSRSFERHTCAF